MKKLLTLTFSLFLIFFFSPNIFSQTQVGSDIDGEDLNDQSGSSVSISADGLRTAIGSPSADGGQVRVYEWSSNTWNQMGNDIDAENVGDRFGGAVKLSDDGNRLVVGGAYNDGCCTNSNRGHIRVFEWDGTDWNQVGGDIDGLFNQDRFGQAVAISDSGNIVAGSSLQHSAQRGHVRIFEWDGTTWNQIGLEISGAATGDFSGKSIDLSSNGTRVAIGAAGNDSNGTSSGHVRIWEWDGTSWMPNGSIIGESSGDQSGTSVSFSDDGNTIAVGAPKNDGSGFDNGHARIFSYNGTFWVQKGSDIDGTGNFSGVLFGGSVSLSSDGNIIAIGGSRYDLTGQLDIGITQIYEWNGITWIRVENDIIGESAEDFSGTSVNVSSDGTRVIIGANGNDDAGVFAGHARIYDVVPQNLFYTFLGSVDNLWDNPANWSTGFVPSDNHNVFIDASATSTSVEIPSGYTAKCNHLVLNKNIPFNINGKLEVDSLEQNIGDLTLNGIMEANRIWLNGTPPMFFRVNGLLDVRGGDSNTKINMWGGVFENHGDVEAGSYTGKKFLFSTVSSDVEIKNFGAITQSTGNVGQIELQGGTFTNEVTGEMYNFDNGSGADFTHIKVGGSASFINKGEIAISASTAIDRTGLSCSTSFLNESTGTVDIAGIDVSPIILTSTCTFTNHGFIQVAESNSGLLVDAFGLTTTLINSSTGVIIGTGELSYELIDFQNAGEIMPGLPIGIITFKGSPSSSMDLNDIDLQIRGTGGAGDPNGHDEIKVINNSSGVSLIDLSNVDLTLTTLFGFLPQLGNQFKIITCNPGATTFASTDLPPLANGWVWDISYSSTGVTLEVILNPLPVELSSFDVKNKNTTHQLNWRTESESNSSHFEIEYSTDGIIWEKKGSVTSHGESATPKNYTFENVWNRNYDFHYYRLKMIDLDDTFEYSEIKSIQTDGSSGVNFYPNPFSDFVTIELQNKDFEIINAQGQIVFEGKTNGKEVDLSHLSKGIYFIKNKTNQPHFFKKIVKVK